MNHLSELEAMRTVYETLQKLEDANAQARVMAWVSDHLKVPAPAAPKPAEHDKVEPAWDTLADVFHAASPATNQEKALVAGYWLQVCQGKGDFDGFSVNRELHNLGHGLANVTDAFTQLRSKKLALQVGKAGKSQQARKRYKLTQAGVKAAEEMIRRGMV